MENIPYISTEQMAKVDQLAVESGLLVMQMMEIAGYSIARFTQKFPEKKVLILAGKGHNGGDGIAAARHLSLWGHQVILMLAEPPKFLKENSNHHYNLVSKMPIEIVNFDSKTAKDHFENKVVIIDALLGYNIDGHPREPYSAIINLANQSNNAILSVDLPSGLNGSTGQAFTPCIKATATLTLDLPKTGLIKKAAKKFIGDLYLCDLGIPNFIHEQLGITIPKPIFTNKPIIKLT